MAVTKGTWLGLPDFGFTEFFTGGTQPGTEPRGSSNVPADVQSQVNAGPGSTPARNGQVQGLYTSNTPYGPNNNPNQTLAPTGQKKSGGGGNGGGGQQNTGGLTADILRNRFGLNDQNVINSILGDPAQVQRYLNELGVGGGGSEQQQISDLYEPYRQELERIAGGVQERGMKALQDVEANYGEGTQQLGSEQADLEKALALQERQLNQGAQSGYSDALRAYNALKQQGMTRYGGGSSTGGAIGELIGQQFMRTTGQARQQTENAKQQLGLELGKVKTYIGGKKTELDTWKREATRQINDNLSSKLDEINLKRGELESNKMVAKQDALRQAIADTKAIQAKDNEFKQGLAQWTIDQMQKTSGRAFTPEEVASVYNEVIGQTYSGLTGGPQANAQSGFQFNNRKPQTEEDQLRAAGLI